MNEMIIMKYKEYTIDEVFEDPRVLIGAPVDVRLTEPFDVADWVSCPLSDVVFLEEVRLIGGS